MDFVQNSNFFYRRFSKKSYQKRSFLILWKEKNDFKRKKLKVYKGPKNGHFPKGLVLGFCSEMEPEIVCFFLRKLCQKMIFL